MRFQRPTKTLSSVVTHQIEEKCLFIFHNLSKEKKPNALNANQRTFLVVNLFEIKSKQRQFNFNSIKFLTVMAKKTAI
jgi:hypothetical protein